MADTRQVIEQLDKWYNEGQHARENGLTCPYRAGTLAYYMHVNGFLSRDLQIALSKSSKTYTLVALRNQSKIDG